MDERANGNAKQGRPRGSLPLLSWSVVAKLQAVYYLITGLWPLFHIRSFLKVTGPKTDLWLVKTVGVLITVIGGVLGLGATRGTAQQEMTALAVGSAVALTGVDVYYVARRRISPIYLLDAAGEIVLIVGWILSGRSAQSGPGRSRR